MVKKYKNKYKNRSGNTRVMVENKSGAGAFCLIESLDTMYIDIIVHCIKIVLKFMHRNKCTNKAVLTFLHCC